MPSEHKKRNNRRKLFIDPPVQGALLLRLFMHWSVATLLILHVFSHGVEQPFSFHATRLWELYGVLLVVMACFMPAFIYDSIKLSHRFAGPVFALKNALRRMARGEDIGELKFRKSDFWSDILVEVNEINRRLQQQPEPQTDSVDEEPETAVETAGV